MRFSVEINLSGQGHRDDGWWRAEIARLLGDVSNHVAARRPVSREPIIDRGREVGFFTAEG